MQGLGVGLPCTATQVIYCINPGMPHVEQCFWSHSGCNPSILARQPSQGDRGSVHLGGNASFRAHSSEGKPYQFSRHNWPLVGIWHWVRHGQTVSMFFWEKTHGFDLG